MELIRDICLLKNMLNWSDLRTEIEETRQRLEVSENQFRPLKIREWRGIEEKIYHTFCNLNNPVTRPIWLWERFKLENYAVYSHDYPLEIVDRIVESKEKVWLMLNESAAGKKMSHRYFPSNGPPEGILVELGRGDKFWFYEGEIKAIQTVLSDSGYIDEIYIVSKKYEWLLCINHHDVLYATGGEMPTKLRQLEASLT